MSTVIKDKSIIQKDPQAERPYMMNWTDDLAAGASIQTSTWIITGPDSVLTKDNEAIAADGRSASVRLLGGTVGKTYTVVNRIVTNETPSMKDDASFFVAIRES